MSVPPPSQFHPPCKICDRGELIPKKIFRMSGPVVAIGFILLVPSVLGMLAAGLMFFGVFAFEGNDSNRATIVEDNDTQVRRACINQPIAYSPVGLNTAEYCECVLTEFKKTGSVSRAATLCAQRHDGGTLAPVDEKTKSLYVALEGTSPPNESERSNNQSQGTPLFHVIGGTIAIALGVTSFVGGLLGWLLVMKKRVLQCSVCGVTVNTS